MSYSENTDDNIIDGSTSGSDVVDTDPCEDGGAGGTAGSENSNDARHVSLKKCLLVIACTAAAILVTVFICESVYYSSHFLPGTYIGFFDVEGMTADTARQQFISAIDDYEITIVTREEDEDITIKSSDLGVTVSGSIDFYKLLKSQNYFAWFLPAGDDRAIEISDVADFDEALFNEWFSNEEYFDNSLKADQEDVPAHYDAQTKLYVAGGVQSNRLDLAKTRAAIKEAVRHLTKELNLDEAGLYIYPVLDDPTEAMYILADKLNTYLATAVILDMGADTTETIDSDILVSCISYDSDYNIVFDEEILSEYICELENKYDTIGTARSFTTHSGTVLEISGGTYGWDMSVENTLAAVLEALESGEKEVTIDTGTIFTQTGWAHDGVNGDIGDSYMEVDITNQKVYCYIDGEEVWSSDCVTGDAAKNRTTPIGIYYIIYKQRDRTLRGDLQTDGQYEYESFVNYWMCWTYTGVGFHDATWRSSFGGTIYYTDGSHGCVNLPLANAAELYEIVYKQMPVVSYGGENDSSVFVTAVTISGADECAQGQSVILTHKVEGAVLNSSVTWSIKGQTSSKTKITSEGVLTVGSDETALRIVVTAVSKQDKTISASKAIRITAPAATESEETKKAAASNDAEEGTAAVS